MTTRRTVLAALALALAAVPATALGTADPTAAGAPAAGLLGPISADPQDTGATGTATEAGLEALAAADSGSKVETILHPLASVPNVTADATELVVELDPEAVPRSDVTADLDAYEATLTPSFGGAETTFTYHVHAVETAESTTWSQREVTRVTFQADDPTRVQSQVTPVLHDLTVTGPGLDDTQPRAVEVTDAFSENPRFVVLADPQVGDGRALEDGFRQSQEERSPDPFLDRADKIFGQGTDDTRWKAFQRTVHEINLLDPDFVLVAGDLTLGQAAPGEYHAEYEDAYRIVNQIQAPTYLSVGNHDGYVQSGEDGFAFWEEYFGPLNYSVDYGDQAHIVSVNTYDWSEMDRMTFSVGASTYGGQVQDDQLAWLQKDLADYRAENPDGLVLSFSHHNPSWRQDDYHNETPAPQAVHTAEDYPVTEQIARGFASTATTGQGWVGDNRLDTRDALRDADHGWPGEVIHFAGHTHRDRVARSVDGGHVVETTQKAGVLPDGESPQDLHYVHRDGSFDTSHTQDELADRLQDWTEGPLFVDTTTVSSSTNEYFGWRLVDLTPNPDASGYGLAEFGYDASRSFLDDHANDPSFWNASHADLGLFSTPSFRLEIVDASGGPDATEAQATVESDLAESYQAVVPLTLDADGTATATSGTIVWERTADDVRDVGVAVTVPADGSVTAEVTVN